MCNVSQARIGVLLALILIFASSCTVIHAPDSDSRQRALQLIDRGVLYLRQGDLVRAEASFKVAQELAELPAAVDGLGCVALLKGENQQAEELFKRALEIDFRYTEALGNLALLYEQMALPEQAESYFRKSILLDPGNIRIRNNYAIFLAHKSDKQVDSAREQLLKASVLMDTPMVEANMLELSKRGEVSWRK